MPEVLAVLSKCELFLVAGFEELSNDAAVGRHDGWPPFELHAVVI